MTGDATSDPRSGGGDRRRENARERDQRDRARAKALREDELKYGGHAVSRHVDVSAADTARRAQETLTSANGRGDHRRSDSTRWVDDVSLARAVDCVERTDAYRKERAAKEAELRNGAPPEAVRLKVQVPIEGMFEGDFRRKVAGHAPDAQGVRPSRFNSQTQVVAIWQPKPGGAGDCTFAIPTR